MFLGMETSMNILHPNLVLFFLRTFIFLLRASAESSLAEPRAPVNSVQAIFVFGDSTSDPGNNNYIRTPFKSDFAPYGRDLPDHVATGRFSNGRLSTDFIGTYVTLVTY